MPSARTIELPGEKMRKAVEEYCELRKQLPEKSRTELINRVSQHFDLSPMECNFLLRQICDSDQG